MLLSSQTPFFPLTKACENERRFVRGMAPASATLSQKRCINRARRPPHGREAPRTRGIDHLVEPDVRRRGRVRLHTHRGCPKQDLELPIV